MALIRIGDSGDAVRDIQERLAALGFSSAPDEPGEFGTATEAAVRAFQDSRRIACDGLIGRETWRTLVDAGYSLGDRLLFHRMPMLHGEDVAELQRRLNAIGFDAGPVDGIFGPDTLRAVLDFQQNRSVAEDGLVGPLIVAELELMSRETAKMGRHELRERVWLSSMPGSLAGQRVFIDPFCRDDREAAEAWSAATGAASRLRETGAHPLLSRSLDTRPAERLRAEHANERAADIVVAFALQGTDVVGVYYFSSSLSRSESGASMAEAVARQIGVEAIGRSIPLLRETRAPAIVVSLPHLDGDAGASVASALVAWYAGEVDQPSSVR
ncbi:MAG TPA: peptidoglycan-binding protein [Acidimicrobiia bacterium]|nr:peptidoglycan-binding protein [Acidimicrobiia bacterium]